MIETALRLLDEVGLDGLTVRRLATELGVQSPALYWHLRNKQELLDGMADAIVVAAGMGPPRDGESWQDWLARRARAYRESLLAHRDGARIVANAARLSPATLRTFDEELTAMVGHGFTPLLALRTITALTHYTNGAVLQEQATRQERTEGQEPAGETRTGPRAGSPVTDRRTGSRRWPDARRGHGVDPARGISRGRRFVRRGDLRVRPPGADRRRCQPLSPFNAPADSLSRRPSGSPRVVGARRRARSSPAGPAAYPDPFQRHARRDPAPPPVCRRGRRCRSGGGGAAQDRARPVRRRVGTEPRVAEPAGELGERDLGLQPGQRRAEAVVDAAAEAEVLVVRAVGVEAVGVGEAVGVAVAGGEHERDGEPFGDGGAGDVDVVEGGAVGAGTAPAARSAAAPRPAGRPGRARRAAARARRGGAAGSACRW